LLEVFVRLSIVRDNNTLVALRLREFFLGDFRSDSSVGESSMALTPFFGGNGRNSIFDPFDHGFWDPVDSWPSSFFGRNVGRDVQAVASTRIDWVETPEAHVFKADLPGKHAILPCRSYLSPDCLHKRTC
jgi:hypothetical protein